MQCNKQKMENGKRMKGEGKIKKLEKMITKKEKQEKENLGKMAKQKKRN